MSDEELDPRGALIREVRQRLESLRRAGVDHIPFVAVEPLPVPQDGTPEAVRPTLRLPDPPPPPPPRPASPPPDAAPPRAEPAPAPPRAAVSTSLFGEPQFETSLVPEAEREGRLLALAEQVSGCAKCPHLAASRTRTVFGEGSPTARLMFIGEAPGAEEDRTGRPFVGRAGALLTDMITKGMGLDRAEVYIANVLKSRPPENRDPLPDEVAHCLPYLEQQVAIIRPQFLCLLGRIAAQTLLETALPMGRLRGKWHRYRGIPTVVTYHPSYLLRNPAAKKDAWADLQMLMQAMGLRPPTRSKG